MAVTAATIMEDVWETIEGYLDDITTGSIRWSGAHPSDKMNSKSDYPVGVIDNPNIVNFGDLDLNLTTADLAISVPITAYDTNPKQCNQIISDAITQISTNKSSLKSDGLHFDVPFIGSTRSGQFMRSGIKVHWIQIDFRFRYTYGR